MMEINYKNLNLHDLNNEFLVACSKGDLKLIKYLLTSPELEQHAEIRCDNSDCIQLATKYGHLEVLKYLLTSSELKIYPDVHSKNTSVFRVACEYGQLDILKYFLFDPSICSKFKLEKYSYEAIIRGIYYNNLTLVDYILNEPEITKHNFDYNKGKILEAACECGRLDILKYLVDLPAFNKNLDFHFGNDTCFKGAYYYSHLDIVGFLILDLNLAQTEDIKKYINESNNPNMSQVDNLFNMRYLNNELHSELSTNELKNKKLKV